MRGTRTKPADLTPHHPFPNFPLSLSDKISRRLMPKKCILKPNSFLLYWASSGVEWCKWTNSRFKKGDLGFQTFASFCLSVEWFFVSFLSEVLRSSVEPGFDRMKRFYLGISHARSPFLRLEVSLQAINHTGRFRKLHICMREGFLFRLKTWLPQCVKCEAHMTVRHVAWAVLFE